MRLTQFKHMDAGTGVPTIWTVGLTLNFLTLTAFILHNTHQVFVKDLFPTEYK
jgi:hypothetical protein